MKTEKKSICITELYQIYFRPASLKEKEGGSSVIWVLSEVSTSEAVAAASTASTAASTAATAGASVAAAVRGAAVDPFVHFNRGCCNDPGACRRANCSQVGRFYRFILFSCTPHNLEVYDQPDQKG